MYRRTGQSDRASVGSARETSNDIRDEDFSTEGLAGDSCRVVNRGAEEPVSAPSSWSSAAYAGSAGKTLPGNSTTA